MPTRRATLAAALPATLLARGAAAAAGRPLVVVELFTSQSCSSCPPADLVLTELAAMEDRLSILPLAFHVTYWDRLGWRDRFSLPEATERQRRYAGWLRSDTVYTPQAVVQGRAHYVGSDRPAILGAIERARAAAAAGPALSLAREGDALAATAGAAAGTGAGRLWLVGYDPRQVTPVRGGENSGRTLTESQVVRSLRAVGEWDGGAQRYTLPMPAAGARAALLLQGADGAILAATRLAPLPGT